MTEDILSYEAACKSQYDKAMRVDKYPGDCHVSSLQRSYPQQTYAEPSLVVICFDEGGRNTQLRDHMSNPASDDVCQQYLFPASSDDSRS
jgi:hypothetical protein